MKKKYNAFSLMEMMVVLLIVAIVAAASAPMINKKVTSLQGDTDCLWTDENSGISYNSAGADNIAVMIGASDRNVTNTSLFIASNNTSFMAFTDRNGREALSLNVKPEILAVGLSNADGKLEDNAVAIGYSTSADEHGTAIGQGAQAGTFCTAIGNGARAEHSNSVALGAGTVTSQANQIVLGRPQDTVLIQGNLRVNGIVEFHGTNGANGRPLRILSGFNNEGFYAFDTNWIGGNRAWTPTNIPATLVDSDRRLKNVGERFTAGLEEVNKLDLYNYTYKKDEAKTPHVGVMAQDLMKIFPNAVNKGEDGYYRIRMEDMFYAAINSIKELDTKFSEIKEQIKTFLDKITAVETSVEELKATIATQQATIDAQQKAIEAQQKALDDLTKKVEKLSKKKTAEEPKAEVKVEE